MPQSIEHTTYTRQYTHTRITLYFHTNLKENCVDKLTKDFLFNTVLLYGLIVRIILYEAKY